VGPPPAPAVLGVRRLATDKGFDSVRSVFAAELPLSCRWPASAGDCGQPAALVKLALGGLGAGLHDICDQRLHDSYLEML
jgi:hypothetical protein